MASSIRAYATALATFASSSPGADIVTIAVLMLASMARRALAPTRGENLKFKQVGRLTDGKAISVYFIRRGNHSPPHWHGRQNIPGGGMELHLVVEGSGSLFLTSVHGTQETGCLFGAWQERTVNAGELLLLEPGVAHTIRAANDLFVVSVSYQNHIPSADGRAAPNTFAVPETSWPDRLRQATR